MDKNKITNLLVENLKDTFNEKLSSVILYGSCATDNCDNKFSDINVIVLIENLNANDLKNSHKIINKWIKTKNPIPLFMDKEEWFNSTDVYPIEYSDIKERYRILYGEDIVATVTVDINNLRLQCELEVKNLLIKLRQTYLASSSNNRAIEALIKNSSKSFLAIFRAILRLTNKTVPHNHNEVVDMLSETVKIDKQTFKKILEYRTDPKALKKDEFQDTIQELIDSTDKILKYVDKFEKQEGN